MLRLINIVPWKKYLGNKVVNETHGEKPNFNVPDVDRGEREDQTGGCPADRRLPSVGLASRPFDPSVYCCEEIVDVNAHARVEFAPKEDPYIGDGHHDGQDRKSHV